MKFDICVENIKNIYNLMIKFQKYVVILIFFSESCSQTLIYSYFFKSLIFNVMAKTRI